MIEVPVSIGEVVDKIAILQIKQEKIDETQKRANVTKELNLLQERLIVQVDSNLIDDLKAVNEQLWEIEDQIRILEKKGDFGPEFVRLARAVYKINDKRAELKRQINLSSGSELMEEKSYE